MPRVVHFEFYVDDPEQAVRFYQEVFDWKITKWEGSVDYWLVTTGEEDELGIDGAIARRMDGVTTRNIIDVPSVDEFIRKIVNAGGKVVMPKQAIPGIGYSAYCADTDGHILTNQHIVHEAEKITVTIPGKKKKLDAKVVGTDVQTDGSDDEAADVPLDDAGDADDADDAADAADVEEEEDPCGNGEVDERSALDTFTISTEDLEFHVLRSNGSSFNP